MENELEPCPVCGEATYESENCDRMFAVQIDSSCGHYVLQEEYDPAVALSRDIARAKVKAAHSDLARRAEIGALVDRIVDGLGYVQMECEADANGEAGMYDVRSHDAGAYTDTLLDALRALAKEVSGDR